MHAYLSYGTQSSWLLELFITSEILARTKPCNSEYSRFSLNLISADNIFYVAKASAPGILSTE